MWSQILNCCGSVMICLSIIPAGHLSQIKSFQLKILLTKVASETLQMQNEPGEHALQYFTTHMYFHLIFMWLNLTKNKFFLKCRLHFPLWYLEEFYALECDADTQSNEELLGISQGSYFPDILYDYCKAKIWFCLQLWNRMQGNEEPSKIFHSRRKLEAGSNKRSFITCISDL